jgi:hypothetical protein
MALGVRAGINAAGGTSCPLGPAPPDSTKDIQRATSLAEELTPPEGCWRSVLKPVDQFCRPGMNPRSGPMTNTPFSLTWPSARLGLAWKSANRELVDAMPSGL